MTVIPSDDQELLNDPIRVPEHVAVRMFGEESVALNLQTGSYYGLNTVAARMFELLSEADSAGDTIPGLVEEYGQPREIIERDLAQLMRGLVERGLVEIQDRGVSPTEVPDADS